MELKNCPGCGKLFACISRNLCPECIAQEDEMLSVIQCYLDEHRNATISEIIEGTGVPGEKIVSLLQDGRLVAAGATCLLSCERCGAPISYGRFCSACSTILKESFKEVADVGGTVPEEDKKESGARMYVSGIYRKPSR